MKRVAIVLALALCGCGHTPPPNVPPVVTSDPNAARNAQIIQLATSESLVLGLNVYTNEGHRDEALVIAAKIRDIVNASALPYLDGNTGATSAGINAFLSSQLLALPDEAKSLIALAAKLLDAYLSPPSASSVLSADQLSYIKAFFNGLNDGAAQFIANPPTVTTVKAKVVRLKSTGKWFNID